MTLRPPLSTARAQVVTTEGPIQALRPCSPDAILGNLASRRYVK
jgi:hypothetical protein